MGDQLPLSLDLKIWVRVNAEFLHPIHLLEMTVNPTEHVDVSCELAAAVDKSWLIHLLHLLPLVSVNVIPMTVGYCSTTTVSSTCDIDKIFVYHTHAVVVQCFGTEMCDLSATECVVIVFCEHSALSGIVG